MIERGREPFEDQMEHTTGYTCSCTTVDDMCAPSLDRLSAKVLDQDFFVRD